MLAAVENDDPAGRDRPARAPLAVLERGSAGPARLGRAGPGQVPVLLPDRGTQGGLGVRRGEGQGRPQGPYPPACSSRSTASRATTPRPSGASASWSRTKPERRLGRDDAGPARRAAGDRRRRPGRPRRGQAARREGRRADPRVPRAVPDRPVFLQAECDLAARRRRLTRAMAITQEIDEIGQGLAGRPALRARSSRQGAAPRGGRGLRRGPRPEPPASPTSASCSARLSLRAAARPTRRSGRPSYVLDADDDRPDAAPGRGPGPGRRRPGPPAQVAGQPRPGDRAARRAIKARARASPTAYHLTRRDPDDGQGPRPRRSPPSRTRLKANPDDAAAWPSSSSSLAEPRGQGPPADRGRARRGPRPWPRLRRRRDAKGDLALAVAVGFHKAGQLDLALPWAEKAAAKLDSPSRPPQPTATSCSRWPSRRARPGPVPPALRPRRRPSTTWSSSPSPNSVEAVNNKAWILHSYLSKSQEALELAQGLLKRVDPGPSRASSSTRSARSRRRWAGPSDAEESYTQGLGKSPDHPVLNYHMGKLMAADRARAGKAANYLKVAQAASDRLPAAMAAKLSSLMKEPAPN